MIKLLKFYYMVYRIYNYKEKIAQLTKKLEFLEQAMNLGFVSEKEFSKNIKDKYGRLQKAAGVTPAVSDSAMRNIVNNLSKKNKEGKIKPVITPAGDPGDPGDAFGKAIQLEGKKFIPKKTDLTFFTEVDNKLECTTCHARFNTREETFKHSHRKSN